ncbi:hypothetical protein EVAR_49439_1 [Eumeta japonica]|uniref:Uncharacterized protein n=1 Tax=Eumeta variegata TaxID=151549 RepID=A0A4C1Y2W0_EUMVA|nr:hypothetical protein EVAR_49439_1 [Eumeta japonica]
MWATRARVLFGGRSPRLSSAHRRANVEHGGVFAPNVSLTFRDRRDLAFGHGAETHVIPKTYIFYANGIGENLTIEVSKPSTSTKRLRAGRGPAGAGSAGAGAALRRLVGRRVGSVAFRRTSCNDSVDPRSRLDGCGRTRTLPMDYRKRYKKSIVCLLSVRFNVQHKLTLAKFRYDQLGVTGERIHECGISFDTTTTPRRARPPEHLIFLIQEMCLSYLTHHIPRRNTVRFYLFLKIKEKMKDKRFESKEDALAAYNF